MRHLALVVDHSGAEDVNNQRLPRKGNLLFVDPDALLTEMMERGLSLSRPKWSVIATRHPHEALAALEEQAELDAIITEVVFDDSAEIGKAFIREVARQWPEIPVFVMTRLDPDETRGLDAAEVIAKPPDMDFLVSRIDRTIRRQRESLVRGISLPTFLQIMEIERKTCTLVVSHGGRVGELFFRDGRLMQARMGAIEGPEALHAMLNMREHSLRVIDRCDVAERKIFSSLTSLMMEWSVREDQETRVRSVWRDEDDE